MRSLNVHNRLSLLFDSFEFKDVVFRLHPYVGCRMSSRYLLVRPPTAPLGRRRTSRLLRLLARRPLLLPGAAVLSPGLRWMQPKGSQVVAEEEL